MKSYLVGLLVIGLFIQPWFFGKLIGLNMDFGPLSYFSALFLELIIVVVLYLPYAIGSSLLKEDKGSK